MSGCNTFKTSTGLFILLAMIVPLWPISFPGFMLLAWKTYKDPK